MMQKKKKKNGYVFIQERDVRVFELCASGPHHLANIAESRFDVQLTLGNGVKKQPGYSKVKNRLAKLVQYDYLLAERHPVKNFNCLQNFYRLAPKAREYLNDYCEYRPGEARLCDESHNNLVHDLLVRDVWKHIRDFMKKKEGRYVNDYLLRDEFSQRENHPEYKAFPDIEVQMYLRMKSARIEWYTCHFEICSSNRSFHSIYKKAKDFKECNRLFFITQTASRRERLRETCKELQKTMPCWIDMFFAAAPDFFKDPFVSLKSDAWVSLAGAKGSIFMITNHA